MHPPDKEKATPAGVALKRILQKQAYQNLPSNSSVLFNFTLNKDATWKEIDRRWFATHPYRSFRLRRIFEGEFPQHDRQDVTHCIVRQIDVGFRDKIFLSDTKNGEVLDRTPDSEELLISLWEILAKADERAVIPIKQVIEKAQALIAAVKKSEGGIQ